MASKADQSDTILIFRENPEWGVSADREHWYREESTYSRFTNPVTFPNYPLSNVSKLHWTSSNDPSSRSWSIFPTFSNADDWFSKSLIVFKDVLAIFKRPYYSKHCLYPLFQIAVSLLKHAQCRFYRLSKFNAKFPFGSLFQLPVHNKYRSL